MRILEARCYALRLLDQNGLAPESEIDDDDPTGVVPRIVAAELILGIVAEPSFDSKDRYGDLVFAIARELDGLVFNGSSFIEVNGSLLLEPKEED